MKVLLLGEAGQIGFELARRLRHTGKLFTVPRDRIDLLDPGAIAPIVDHIQPDWILNAVAYTQVDAAERDKDLAFALNQRLPLAVAVAASNARSRLIHFSTDYVFDGTKTFPYTESDPVSPINVYGSSKAAGEQAIRETLESHLIFRTSWIYSRRRANFLLTMERLLVERQELQVVCDQVGAPTSAPAVADAVIEAMQRIAPTMRVADAAAPFWGTYHLTCGGETSWYGFASAIRFYLTTAGAKARLTPVTSEQYETAARRPLNSRLSNKKFEQIFDFRMPTWQSALQAMYCEGDTANANAAKL